MSLARKQLIVLGMQDGKQVYSKIENSKYPRIEEENKALCITVEAIEQLSKKEAQTPTSEECPDEDIVQSILGGKELETTDAEDSDESTPVFVPNFKQCLTAIDTVKSYIHLAWKTKLCICTDQKTNAMQRDHKTVDSPLQTHLYYTPTMLYASIMNILLQIEVLYINYNNYDNMHVIDCNHQILRQTNLPHQYGAGKAGGPKPY